MTIAGVVTADCVVGAVSVCVVSVTVENCDVVGK